MSVLERRWNIYDVLEKFLLLLFNFERKCVLSKKRLDSWQFKVISIWQHMLYLCFSMQYTLYRKKAGLLSHKSIFCLYAFKYIAVKVPLLQHIWLHFPFLKKKISTTQHIYIYIYGKGIYILHICYLFFYSYCVNHFITSENDHVGEHGAQCNKKV
jgi:hypothetical protein